MRKFTFFLSMLFAMTVMAQTGGYEVNYTGTKNSDRPLNFVKVESASYGSSSYNLTAAEKLQLYVDATETVTLKVGAGDVVTPSIGYGGSWMHAYVYVDANGDGTFTADVADDGYTPTGDLVSYSAYNADPDGSGLWRNSAGEQNGNNTVALPTFKAPETVGTYRMRFKTDWNSIDPAGCDKEGNTLRDNRGAIIDVTLEVAEAQEGFAEQLFNATTITDGEFAKGTAWYTLQIGANNFVIADNGTANHLELSEYISDATDNAQLWAFVGDNTNGYKLYNKNTGTAKVLAAPTTMGSNTGGNAFPILVDATAVPAGYTDMWMFTSSADLGEGDTYFYMYEKGYPANKVNNRDNKLAFWNGGADAGSTLNIQLGQVEYPVSTMTGEWTASNAAGTWAAGWKSTNAPHAILQETQGRNNIAGYNGDGDLQLYTCLANATVNGVFIATYSVSSGSEDYMVAGYSFDFVSSGTNDVTVTPNGGEAVTASSANAANVLVVNSEESALLTFDVTSTSNMFANTSNFYITLVRKAPAVEPSQEIFTTNKGGIPYRIPAIAMAKNGDLIAVADYRHSGADIGVVNNGRIDLHARISKDNGASWENKFAIVEGQGSSSPDFMHVGFGDPCIVADRESDRVLVLSCAGNVSFQSGTRNNHQNIARFYSEDNGATWSEPVDIADAIYAMWDNSNHGPVMAMFVGSGKIHQSRYVKVNDYYRLYCAVLLKNKNATYTNFVLYSDDFGGTWDVLGGVNTAPIPSGGDEPKVEELPNGNVVISSRINGGRDFNIFTFTDKEAATGSWGTRATSNASNNGVVALGNSTNGEIMIMPAVRNEDGEKVWIALQSLPFGSGRTNVGIYYKELASSNDYNTPANFAKDWDGRHQSTFIGSAYSTMCFQKDSTIAFLYEESTHGADYTIVYKNYTLEQITDGAYSISNHTTAPEPEPEPEPEVPEESALVLALTAEQLGTNYPYQLNDEDAAKIFALNDITVAVKFNTASLGGRKALFATADPTQTANTNAMGTNSYYVAYGMNNADLGYLASWRDGDRYTAGNCIPANAEDNVAVFVINPTNNNFRSYLNGSNIADRNFGTYEIASPAMVKADYPDANIYIGGAEHAGGYGEIFNGTITGVKVFKGALTADEIAAINFDVVEPEPEPTGPVVITEVDQLSNAKLYTITSSDAGRGNFYALDSKVDMCAVTYSAGSDACHQVAYNAEDPKQQFAFVNYEGKFYIYSVSEKKFIAKDGNVNKLTAEAPFDYITVEKVIEAGENTFALMANDTHYFTASPGWCSNASRNTCIQSTLTSKNGNDGWDAGAWFIITEVGEFDATEALAMLTPAEPEVEPLEVVNISPADGETVEKLEQIVVTFNAPVTLDETKNIHLVAAEITPIEAYAGKWEVTSGWPGYPEFDDSEIGTIEVVDYAGVPALLCKGFSGYNDMGYDDSFLMMYNSEDGTVSLESQQLGEYDYYGTVYESLLVCGNTAEEVVFTGSLVGRIENGNIVFESVADNKYVADSWMFYAPDLGGISYFNSLVWTPAAQAAAPAKAAVRNNFKVEFAKNLSVAAFAKSKVNRADENVANIVSASINPDDATQLIITVNEVLENGTYKLTIEAGAVVTAEGATNETIICTYILNGPTGIDEVEGESGEVKAIYDLQGRKVAEPTKGIYIIDGKKVLVK